MEVGQRDGLVAKNAYYSCRGSKFSFQQPRSQLPADPGAGNLTCTFGTCEHTHTQIKISLKTKKKWRPWVGQPAQVCTMRCLQKLNNNEIWKGLARSLVPSKKKVSSWLWHRLEKVPSVWTHPCSYQESPHSTQCFINDALWLYPKAH